ISGLCHAALAPAAYASRIVLPPSLQGSLPAGWLSLYREGVEPSGSLQKVSDHPSSFSGLSLAQGKFHFEPPSASHHSITSSASASRADGTSRRSAVIVMSGAKKRAPLGDLAKLSRAPSSSAIP